MIIKIIHSDKSLDGYDDCFIEYIECNQFYKYTSQKDLRLEIFRNNDLVLEICYDQSITIYVMENGKTVNSFSYTFKEKTK